MSAGGGDCAMGDGEGEEPHAQALPLLLLLLILLLLHQHLILLWARNSLLVLLIAHLACSPPSYSPAKIKSEYTEKKKIVNIGQNVI